MATARSLNKAMIIGNLTRDPEVKYTPQGSLVCTFGIATNNLWKTQSGEQKERAEYLNIVAWNKLGEICANLLSVGMLVYVEGEIRTRMYEVNGVKHYRTEIRIDDMKLLDSKGKNGVGVESAELSKDSNEEIPVANEASEEEAPVAKEDLPF